MMKLFAEDQERTLTRKETQTAGEQRRASTRKKNEPLTATFCDLLPSANTRIDGGQHSWTDFNNFTVQGPIFRDYLQELDDEQFSSVARDFVFLCETSIGGPWKIDLFKANLIKEEFECRGNWNCLKSLRPLF
jgi:hypothetical protein